MPERLLLIDTDVLVLLGASMTLSLVREPLGFREEQGRRLPAATWQLERGKPFQETYTGPALRSALEVARRIHSLIGFPGDVDLLEALNRASCANRSAD